MTIECTDFEAEVIKVALDTIASDLIRADDIEPVLNDMADIMIDTATELAQRIEEQLRPDAALIRVERERMQDNIGSMIAVFTDLQNPL